MDTPLLNLLIERFDDSQIDALVVMGSYARGEAHQYSDIDLARFTRADGSGRTQAFKGVLADHLVVVNNLSPTAVEDIFSKPDVASSYLAGLRHGHVLVDRNATFARIQARAGAFTWDERMQQQANAWASEALAGWSEDMRKGLAGLITNDIGQLLSARFASSWGLSRVMQIQRGVLCRSGHDFYAAVTHAVGIDSEWARLRRIAFAITDDQQMTPTLHEQVRAGLHLYIETATLLAESLRSEDRPLITHTMNLITEAFTTTPTLHSKHIL